jgi:hypothetical protein
MLVIHHEPENRAAYTAPETVKGLALRTNVKRWCFLLMKRTERLEIRSGATEWKIRANHLYNVIGGGDLLDCW